MKHIVHSFLLFVFLNMMTFVTSYSQFSGGTGTANDPYLIATEANLELVRNFCGATHRDKHFLVTTSITLSKNWTTPIGNAEEPFMGHFHGGTNTVSGLQINRRDLNYVGLFGYNEGSIDSLYVVGSTIRGGQYVGGLVGYNVGDIIFCHTNISVDGSSLSAAAYVGGLVGYNSADILQSSATGGDIKATGSTFAGAGGLVGYNSNGDIVNCFAKGQSIESTAFGTAGFAYSGGLVGHLNSGAIVTCYTADTTEPPSASSGNPTNSFVGTVVGYNGFGSLSNCYYDNTLLGDMPSTGNGHNTNAVGKNTAGMQTRDVYQEWDFNSVWGIREGIDYPYLRLQPLRFKNVAVNAGSLIPTFSPDTLIYTLDITSSASINITATTAVTGAIISGNGAHVLVPGYNPIDIKLSHDGGELICTINVHREYSLRFDPQGGTVNPPTLTIHSGVNILPVPVRKGHTFDSWNTKPDGDSIAFNDYTVQDAADIDALFAQWTVNEYTLTFDANGGTVSPTNKTVIFGDTVGTLPLPIRNGYTFDKWITKIDGTGVDYNANTVYDIDSSTTVYAQWKAEQYMLNFNINYPEGTSPASIAVTYNSPVGTLPLPTRRGYTFNRWNSNPDGSGDTYYDTTRYILGADLTLYAQWTSSTYSLYFHSQCEIPNPAMRKVTYNTSVGTLPALGSRPHYTSYSWNTLPDGSGTEYVDGDLYLIDADTIFFAVWRGEQSTLSFDINYVGGINPSSRNVYYGTAVGELPSLARTGFVGEWNTRADGTGETYTESTVYTAEGNTTLYAQWTPKTFLLKYAPQGGTGVPVYKSVTFGNPVGTLATPSKDYYTFNEWNTSPIGDGDTYDNNTVYSINKDTTIYAIWTGFSYKLYFDPSGGNVETSEKAIHHGSAVGVLPTPEYQGYAFAGWFTELNGSGEQYSATTVFDKANDVNLYAKWTPQTYILSLNSNGGDDQTSSINVTYGLVIGNELSNRTATRTNYTFVGWNTRADGSGETYNENTIYKIVGNATVYAQWQGVELTVHFHTDNGVPTPPDKIVYYGSPLGGLPSDIRPGYTVTWKDIANAIYDSDTKAYTNLDLYSTWMPVNYTLTFNPQDGFVNPTTKSVTYDAPVGDLPDSPARLGYTFGGWFTGIEGSGNQYFPTTVYSVAGNTTLYAKWIGNLYTLNFDSQGGSVTTFQPVTVTFGSPVGLLPSAGTRQHYQSYEWNTEPDGSGTTYIATTNYDIANDATLFAVWKGVASTLTFDPDGGRVDPASKTVNYDAIVGTLPMPKYPGFRFTGWFDEQNNLYTSDTRYMKTVDTKLKAGWVTRTYQINFNTNYPLGESFQPIENISYDSYISVDLPTPDTRSHYSFGGWNTAPNGSGVNFDKNLKYQFDDDITLYAKWTGELCTLDFNVNYSGNAVTPSPIYVRYGSQIGYLPMPSRTGYTFEGWNKLPDGSDTRFSQNTVYRESSPSTTLYAQWAPEVYVLYFDPRLGEVTVLSKNVTYDSLIRALPVPTRTGYDFLGWNTSPIGNKVDYTESTVYRQASNTTVYAQWKAQQYTLTFNPNKGETSESERAVFYESPTGKLPKPSRTGYTFIGWNTELNGSGEVYSDHHVYLETADRTLYAQWTANQYTLTFKKNGTGGLITPSDPVVVTYDRKIGALPGASWIHHTFIEWNTQPDGNGTAYSGTDIYQTAADQILYAQWRGNPFTITFDPKGGSVNPISKIVNFGSTAALPIPVFKGHTFAGWFDNKGVEYRETTIFDAGADITLSAHWNENRYELLFDANYSGGTNSKRPIIYGEPVPTSPNVSYRPGYTFKEWNTIQDGSGDKYIVGTAYTDTVNTTFYAQWTANNYTVEFDANYSEGTNPASQQVTYGAQIGRLPLLTRTGYSFVGWNAKDHGEGTFYTEDSIYTFADNKILYARWDVNRYTITFDANYAGNTTVIPEQQIDYGAEVGTLPNAPTRTGYTFTKWTTKQNGDGDIYSANTVYLTLGNTSLYAQWSPNSYIIDFDSQGGNLVNDKQVTYNTKINELTVPLRSGYTFDGWFTLPNGGGVKYTASTVYNNDSNTTLYAGWTAGKYFLKFDVQGGDPVGDKQVTYNSTVDELTVPHRTGYAFGGWFTEPDGGGSMYSAGIVYKVIGNTDLYARWTVKQYTLGFDTQSEITVGAIATDYNKVVTLPQPSRTGYVFKEWNTTKEGDGISYNGTMHYTSDRDLILYAQWDVNEYALVFDVQEGSPVNNRPITFDAVSGELPQPTRTGYTFAGWFTDINGGTEYLPTTIYKTAGNTTLYAKWTANSYDLEFNANYVGSINPEKQIVAYGRAITTLPVIARRGYTFVGWNTAQDGSGTQYATDLVYNNTTGTKLYAQWTANSYTIDFDANYTNRIELTEQKKVTYDIAVGLLPVVTRTGYTFKGWNTLKDGSGVTYIATTPYAIDGNTTMYAQWEGNSYALSFDAQGGVAISDHRVVYGALVGALPSTSRPNYTFGGWFTGVNGGGDEYTSTNVYETLGHTVLYAHWIGNNYNITFDAQGGVAVGALQVTYDELTGVLPSATRSGYTFKGWNTDKNGSGITYSATTRYTVDGNIVLYAQWIANHYRLSFDTQSDNLIADRTVIYDSVIGNLPVTSRTGYTFDGWYSELNGGGTKYLADDLYTVSDSVVLYAKWIANRYTLDFDMNCDDDGILNPEGRAVTYGSAAGSGKSLPTPKRNGYVFKGWNTATDGSGITYVATTVYTVPGNTTLYAQWTANSYVISFDANYTANTMKPENPSPQSVVYNSAIGSLPVLDRTGYIFIGWNTNADGNGVTCSETTSYTVLGNTTLYAQWKVIVYTVDFSGVGIDIAPQTVVYGEKVVRPSDPIRTGYVFDGWRKDNDLWDFHTPVTGDLHLTAKWISRDSELKSMSINHGTLSPEFLSSIKDYTVTVPYDVTMVSITAIPSSSNATVTSIENRAIVTGDNLIKVIVTAEDGFTTATYTVVVTREDHIPVTEANLLSLSANGRPVIIEGNRLEYSAACGEKSFTLELAASSYASVAINGSPYSKGQLIDLTGDITIVDLHVVSETGATKDYTLKAYKAIDESRLYYRRWPDILGINANPANNGEYEITGVRWYMPNGDFITDKGYIQIQSIYSGYYAEIKTVRTEGWRRVCVVDPVELLDEIVAYPNPVSYGETMKLELPDHFIGATLNIYDMQGLLVKSGVILSSKTNNIDFSTLASGIYVLDIVGTGSRQSIKIIVE
jgi:uncharacterized repeat protein (TIGR02543 family)